MLEVFLTSVNAIVPIILLIGLGYVLKKIKLINDEFVKKGNKLVFNVLLPCMLFINIYDGMSSFSDVRWDVVIYVVAIILIIFCFGVLVSIITTKRKERCGVILQCTFRSNFAIIGLSLVERLGGSGSIASIVSAFSIPLFNILAVVALSVFGNATENNEGIKNRIKIKDIFLNIIKNPLIIGVVVGLIFVGIREIERMCCDGEIVFTLNENFKFLYVAVKDLKLIASPLALIILGGQFEFSAVRGMTKEIIAGTLCRILVAPLTGIGFAILLSNSGFLSFGADVYPTLIALFGTPVAVSSAIMAGEMGGDEQLATQLVVWTSLCSILSIFLTIFILTACGLIIV